MRLALAALLALGCSSSKDPEPAPEPARPRRADARPQPVAPIATDAAPPKPAIEPLAIEVADLCASPCLLLARHRFAAISEGVYCEVCKEVKARACELEWPPIADEPSCDDWDRWRQCLLAAHGYRFKSARARGEYRRKRWYRARRGVEPAQLAGVARANLAYLETRAAACRKALAARKGRTVARLRGDFDGDGRAEVAVVTDTEVRVGGRSVAHGLIPASEMAAIEASLVDIDSGDRAVEIVVALHQGEVAASRYAVVYVAGEPRRKRRGRPGPLSVGPAIETFGLVEATGAGSLEVREKRCGQTTVHRYGYAEGELLLASKNTEGERDPSRCD